MSAIIQAGSATSTRALYKRAWTLFKSFCAKFHLGSFPASSNVIALFISFMHSHMYATSTIRTFVSAIGYVHKINGLPDPTISFTIQKAFTGLKKLRPTLDKRQPITPSILFTLLNKLPSICKTRYRLVLFRAMFLLAFFALCRVGEITVSPANHNLQLNNVQFYRRPCSYIISFASFKHSSRPQSVKIEAQTSIAICPVFALKEFLNIRSSSPGPLFISSNGYPVKTEEFAQVLKQALKSSQLSPTSYTSHSFRIGGATYAAKIGLTSLQIRRLGRWSSDAYLKYLRW